MLFIQFWAVENALEQEPRGGPFLYGNIWFNLMKIILERKLGKKSRKKEKKMKKIKDKVKCKVLFLCISLSSSSYLF